MKRRSPGSPHNHNKLCITEEPLPSGNITDEEVLHVLRAENMYQSILDIPWVDQNRMFITFDELENCNVILKISTKAELVLMCENPQSGTSYALFCPEHCLHVAKNLIGEVLAPITEQNIFLYATLLNIIKAKDFIAPYPNITFSKSFELHKATIQKVPPLRFSPALDSPTLQDLCTDKDSDATPKPDSTLQSAGALQPGCIKQLFAPN